MSIELQGTALILAVLATLAALVRHDRKVKRWLLRGRRRRRPAASRRPVLT